VDCFNIFQSSNGRSESEIGKGEDRLSLNTINNEKFEFMHWRSNTEKLPIFQDVARASVFSEQTRNTRWKLNETETMGTRIPELLASNPSQGTCYSDWGFSCLFSVPPGKCQDSI
jgi:hypothetical protein